MKAAEKIKENLNRFYPCGIGREEIKTAYEHNLSLDSYRNIAIAATDFFGVDEVEELLIYSEFFGPDQEEIEKNQEKFLLHLKESGIKVR